MIKDVQNLRDDILEASLPFIAEHGWSFNSLIQGGLKMGYTENNVRIAFEGREAEAVKHFSYWLDQQMIDALKTNVDYTTMKTAQKVREALISRLEVAHPHKKACRKMVRFLRNPVHAGLASHLLYKTINMIWYTAGDRATDYNFYTKRLTLMTIYASTLLFWLNDESLDLTKTITFMDRRFKNSAKIVSLKSSLKNNLTVLKNSSKTILKIFNK